ncbi:penicillin acylase family protein [Pseudoflavitalea sp. G-6-1-2]|uniref:penicillin acylase family protein n=1 Tax=Pseudoflavitalea sp. G-6-1-2 TaxID=2728841 RepID=UPI00146BC2BE|nr:penicillin acylase family protein [Pseudoflavitalea sp. G-6-1-2]NML23776.1 penicillin acylase family protein [Pseudoflavitalea sp. G-6-1-2]
MRLVPLLVSGVITIGLILALNRPWGSVPPLGSFLSPQHGCWQNAEPVDQSYSLDLDFDALKEKVSVYFDNRMVPHVFAQNDHDLYFVQGYLHAKFRLWQMEFQTHAAAGRLAEVLGAGPDNAILNNDRNMRRLGMVYAAKNALTVMEADTTTKTVMDSYTAGVNAFIENCTVAELPLEYRLLNYVPEKWTNLKTALFLKYMSYDLSGEESDIEYTNAKAVLSRAVFEKLYPIQPDSLDPIVPKGTAFDAPLIHDAMPANADSAYFDWKEPVHIQPVAKPDKDNGSNNWAVSGSKTASGAPILCSDPHLGLNLPSLWFEMQLHTPGSNAYGVSFPGAPAIIIGFTDQVAWGVTNSSRDVKDYYSIRFKDDSKQQYWFDSSWKSSVINIETIKVKGGADVKDTVAYTVFGPVQYDASFTGSGRTKGDLNLAVRWKAHDASNELRTFYELNRAANYEDYLHAIRNFSCPGQNFVFAAKNNNIAIWQQGSFPAKWRRQGDFIMPGTDSSYLWTQKNMIDSTQNPHLINPERGFVSSANQLPTDSTYPYYLGGSYNLYRGISINRRLHQMSNITVNQMEQLQTDNLNVMAETVVPALLKHLNAAGLSADEQKYLGIICSWNFRNEPKEKAVAIFNNWMRLLESEVWSDEFANVPKPYEFPTNYTLVEGILKDSAFTFADNITTPQVETLSDVITTAFKKAVPEIAKAEQEGMLEWSKYKDSGIRHLLRLSPLSRFHLTTGGGADIINATKQYHGPSWRMVVHLTDKTEAFGIFPGGQSGNPGSKYYDNMVNDWSKGAYQPLWIMTEEDASNKQVKYTMTFQK